MELSRFSPYLNELPNNVEALQKQMMMLYGIVGSLTLENAVLKQQLHEADLALCSVQTAATISRL